MENSKLGIEVKNGKIVEFQFDDIFLEGLFYVDTLKKIKRNKDALNIVNDYSNPKAINYKLTVLEQVAILTLGVDEKNQHQYLIGNDVDIMELLNLSDQDIDKNIKKHLLAGYDLIK